ncbi:MAG: hypothetical protein H8D56_11365 [Planctomycetes bacterium]|nr:hypothetical protein [Planctomycetota bacterium]MBL7145256.1 hypothetical protein [Phycisphaerae bacterium]
MKNTVADQIIIILTIICGIIAIVTFCLTYQGLIILPFFLFLIGIIILVLLNRLLSMRKIRMGLKKIHDEYGQQDLIISFNRSGSIAAGMLSGHYKDVQVLVIDKVKRIKTDYDVETKTYDVGSLVTIHTDKLENRKILILFFVVETGSTLKKGLEYLGKLKIKGKINVATLFISKQAKKNLENVFSVYETSCIDSILKKFPWLFDVYQIDK